MPSARAAAAPPAKSVGRVRRQLDVDLTQRRDLPERTQLVGAVAQRCRHARALGGRLGDRSLQRAVALEQVGGRLLPDPRRARNAVRGIAAQRDEVGHQRGRHAVAAAHLALVDHHRAPLAGRQVQHRAVRPDALEHVAVAGEDQRAAARRRARRARTSPSTSSASSPGTLTDSHPNASYRSGRHLELALDVLVGLELAAVGVVVGEQLDAVVRRILAEGHHDRARAVRRDLVAA